MDCTCKTRAKGNTQKKDGYKTSGVHREPIILWNLFAIGGFFVHDNCKCFADGVCLKWQRKGMRDANAEARNRVNKSQAKACAIDFVDVPSLVLEI